MHACGHPLPLCRSPLFTPPPHTALRPSPPCLQPVADDVPDPFYGLVTPAAELKSLRRAAQSITLGCSGLLAYLLKLRARCGAGPAALPLRTALAQSLQCPLMDPSSHHALSALIHCQLAPAQRALWQKEHQQQGEGSRAAGSPRTAAAPASTPAKANAQAVDWAAHVSGWPRPVWVEPGSSDDEDDKPGGCGPKSWQISMNSTNAAQPSDLLAASAG